MKPDEFQECPTCAAKPGSPALCPACLHNRSLISELQRERREATPDPGLPFWFQTTGLLSAVILVAFISVPLLICGFLFRRKQAAAIGESLQQFIASFFKP